MKANEINSGSTANLLNQTAARYSHKKHPEISPYQFSLETSSRLNKKISVVLKQRQLCNNKPNVFLLYLNYLFNPNPICLIFFNFDKIEIPNY